MTEVRRQMVNLSSLSLKAIPIPALLLGHRLFDLAIEMEQLGMASDFTVYAAATSIGVLCENFGGPIRKGIFESDMFQVACDSAAYMAGQCSAEFAATARFNQGKPPFAQVWMATADQHSPKFPMLSGLCMVRNGESVAMVWGFPDDIKALGITTEKSEGAVH